MFTTKFNSRLPGYLNAARKLAFASALVPAIYLTLSATEVQAKKTQTAILAGGCFWCIEKDFEKLEGVKDVVSGYTGGTTFSPKYEEVTYGGTGHYEAVKITYDPAVISYEKILHLFWRSVDPTDDGGQFCDRGHSYKTAIFYQNNDQQEQAKKSKALLMESGILGKKVVTPILEAKRFWPSEEYHQDYYQKSPIRYKFYRSRCGRDKRVKALWGEEAWAAK